MGRTVGIILVILGLSFLFLPELFGLAIGLIAGAFALVAGLFAGVIGLAGGLAGGLVGILIGFLVIAVILGTPIFIFVLILMGLCKLCTR